MILTLATLIVIANLILGFFHPQLSWLSYAIMDGLLLIVLIAVKISSLNSSEYYYQSSPRTAQSLSSSCSLIAISGIILALIGLFHLYWWGVLWGFINYFGMASISGLFKPNPGTY